VAEEVLDCGIYSREHGLCICIIRNVFLTFNFNLTSINISFRLTVVQKGYFRQYSASVKNFPVCSVLKTTL